MGTIQLIGNGRHSSWFDSVSFKKLRLWFMSGPAFPLEMFDYHFLSAVKMNLDTDLFSIHIKEFPHQFV